ncbi:MAG: SGNH/GDSL hydrolase family protein [Candidatus Melainabacteria bacterium]|nr:SGNH/GDSL hydrolase family protein [Candidatus Melainabacteria bacterium]
MTILDIERKKEIGLSPKAVQKRPSALLFSLGQGLVYLVCLIFALEAFSYIVGVGDSEHIRPDRYLGYNLIAGKRVTQRKEGFGQFKINSFAMQNDEVKKEKPKGVYRIAIFGDSYVESLQVARRANFLSRLQEKLNERLGRDGRNFKVEVLNFGVSNYSTAQSYLRYKVLGSQFKPDLVIHNCRVEEVSKLLPMTTDNLLFVRPVLFADYSRHVTYDDTCVREYFQSAAGRRMLSFDWLRANSRIWGVISVMREQFGRFLENPDLLLSFAPKAQPAASGLPTDETRANFTKCYWYMMDAQLFNFARQCRSDGSDFMILRTPMIRPCQHTLTDNQIESDLLARSAKDMKVEVLNLDERYRRWAGSTTDDGTNFSSGGHFTAVMHEWVAEQLAAKVYERLAK